MRQKGIIPQEELDCTHMMIIGVGAGGRDLALSAAILGVSKITIIDPQYVEEVNLASQGYLEEDIGKSKVEATSALMRKLNSGIQITAIRERFNYSHKKLLNSKQNIVCSSVDSIKDRKFIYNIIKNYADLWIDGRMSAEVIQVYSVYDDVTKDFYPTTLFDQSEAYVGPCTGRSTNFVVKASTGIKLEMITQWMRDIEPPARVEFNLFSMEFFVKYNEDIVRNHSLSQ